MTDVTLTLAGETVSLLPERALYWHRRSTLIVADAHWGKAAAFRASSVAIPGEMTDDDLARLSAALTRTQPEHIVYLGDLLHAKAGRSPRTFAAVEAWRARYSHIEMTLVRGNHDRGAGDPPDDWNIACADAPVIDPPFAFQHFPAGVAGCYALAGHLHPGAILSGGGHQNLKLPCFWFSRQIGVLPAFGSFTGTSPIQPQRGDRIYVVADDEVIGVGG